eukprot:jgi/Chlat1/1413/Chrsp12S02060
MAAIRSLVAVPAGKAACSVLLPARVPKATPRSEDGCSERLSAPSHRLGRSSIPAGHVRVACFQAIPSFSAGAKKAVSVRRSAGFSQKASQAASLTAVSMSIVSLASVDDGGVRRAVQYQNIALSIPLADQDPADWRRYSFSSISQRAFEKVVALNGGFGFAEMDAYLEGGDFDCKVEVPIQDNGRYVLLTGITPLHATVKGHEGFVQRAAVQQENQCAEHGIPWLRDHGYTNPHRLCQKIFKSEDGMLKCEIDGVDLADGVAVLIEAKHLLEADDASKFLVKYVNILIMLEDNAPSVKQLQGRRLLLVLCGDCITDNVLNRRALFTLCRLHNMEIWLPNGTGYSSGDGCNETPFRHPPASTQ